MSFLATPTVTPPAVSAKMPSRLGEQADAFADFVVGHVVGCAAGFLHHAQRVEAVGRRADGERFRNRVRFDGLEEIQSRLLRDGDRRATGRLRAVNVSTSSSLTRPSLMNSW